MTADIPKSKTLMIRTTKHDIIRRIATLNVDRNRLSSRIQAGRQQPLPVETEQFDAIEAELRELEGLMNKVNCDGSWRIHLLCYRS